MPPTSDAAIIAKAGRGASLDSYEAARYKQLASGQTQTGKNIRAWEKGNRKSPT